jgi:hypothetical protein
MLKDIIHKLTLIFRCWQEVLVGDESARVLPTTRRNYQDLHTMLERCIYPSSSSSPAALRILGSPQHRRFVHGSSYRWLLRERRLCWMASVPDARHVRQWKRHSEAPNCPVGLLASL